MNPVIYIVVREGYARGASVERAYWNKTHAEEYAEAHNVPARDAAAPFGPTWRWNVETIELQ